GWNPIGDDSNPFAGIFNGNGYAVRNLWIDRSTNFVGLFGFIGDAQIKNLGVEIDSSKGGVKGGQYVGAIAGRIDGGSITNSYSTGEVSGIYYVGAIAGYVNTNSSITNSYSTGNIGGNTYVGAIAGYVDNSFITDSYSAGDVSGEISVGGIAGAVYYDSSITNSYSTGNVSGDTYVGGIAGDIFTSTIENNAAINQEVNGSSDVNRIVGYISGGSVQNNFAIDTMTTNFGGGFSDAGAPANNGTPRSIDDFKSQSTYESDLGWRFGNNDANPWQIDPNKNGGYPYLYWQK
ncbi:MAG: hypothetical protein LBQ52_07310, partial [Helicobacteraceae bacterium]|nr:hypothetical protein [Helicobacteraceae bacterium]